MDHAAGLKVKGGFCKGPAMANIRSQIAQSHQLSSSDTRGDGYGRNQVET